MPLTSSSPNSRPPYVVNLSPIFIDLYTVQLLEKGFKFALDPCKILVEEILCSIDIIAQNLPPHIAEEI